MSRVLRWGLTVLAVLVTLAIGGIVGLYAAGHELDVESKAFADASVNAIVAGWSPSALLSRSTSQITSAPPGQVEATFAPLRHALAHAQNRGCVGNSTISWSLGEPISTTGGYKCPLDVTGGQSLVNIFVRKTNGVWKVSGFWVNPQPSPEG